MKDRLDAHVMNRQRRRKQGWKRNLDAFAS